MIVKWKRLHPDAKCPTQATAGSAGFDLYLSGPVTYNCNGTVKYHLGIAVEIPAGHVGLLFPRSSIANTKHRVANGVGVIDSDYRGELSVVFDTLAGVKGGYKIGDRIAQLVIVPVPPVVWREADELGKTDRGTGGYGSTGR